MDEPAEELESADGDANPPPEVGVVQFACENCGGQVTATPGEDALTCEHCGHVQPIDRKAGRVVEYDFRAAIASAPRRSADEMMANGHQVECKECGARTVLAGQAGRCPFCGSPVVADLVGAEDVLLPESLLPHKVTREQSKAAFRAWIKSRWFAPSDLSRRAKAQGMDGVFLPYWTYDSDTTTKYTGARGEYYYVTESYTDSKGNRRTRQVRKTRWYPAWGTVRRDFDDVLICASTSLPGKLVQDLEPWDLPALQPYDAAYLAGFVAERYRVDLEAGFAHAEERMEPQIRSDVRSDIGGDVQRIYSMDITHANVTFKHVLLPLWISSFKYGDRTFRVMVNARTGEVQGERPWSWIKITLFVLAILTLCGLAYYAYVRSQEPAVEDTSDPATYEPYVATPEPDAAPAVVDPFAGYTVDVVGSIPGAIEEAHAHGKTLGLTAIHADLVSGAGFALGKVTYDFRSPRGARKPLCDVWVEVDETGRRWQTTDETPDLEACGKPLVTTPVCRISDVYTLALQRGLTVGLPFELRYEAPGKPDKQDRPARGVWTLTSPDGEVTVEDRACDVETTSPGSPASSTVP